MSLRITLYPALIAAAILGACDKGAEPAVEPKTALLAGWQSTAHKVSPGVKSKPSDKAETDFAMATGDCFPLPEITFQSNSKYWMADGVSRCPGFDNGQSDSGIWSLSEDGKTLTLDSDKNSLNVVWKLKSISAKSLTVEYPMEGSVGDGTPQTEILTFRLK